MDKNNKFLTLIILIVYVIVFIIWCLCKYTLGINVPNLFLIYIVIIIITIVTIYYIRDEEASLNLINEEFKVEITNKDNTYEHIRITKNNLMFKYKKLLKYTHARSIFPEFLIKIIARGFPKSVVMKVENKQQLKEDDVKKLIESFDKLSNSNNSKIKLVYKNNIKFVNIDEINAVLKDFKYTI